MIIELRRYRLRPWGLDGELYINGQKVCDTVEHPSKYLPQGLYPIRAGTVGEAHAENCALVCHGDGPLLSKHGEIVVGKVILPGLVKDSLRTWNTLRFRLYRHQERHKSSQDEADTSEDTSADTSEDTSADLLIHISAPPKGRQVLLK